jgi:hypothetical protein
MRMSDSLPTNGVATRVVVATSFVFPFAPSPDYHRERALGGKTNTG